jgi:putative two-component system response regulator
MRSVLIVDDNLATLKQLSAQLESYYEISLAKSGELALQICARIKPDLILLDVEMSGMDGYETIARLKADGELKHIPVIFLTSNNDAATEVKCLESGAVDFVAKPANGEILRHRLALHLEFSAYQLHLEHMVKELEDNIGVSFSELVECKDHNVAGHVMRTGSYAGLLAAELLEEGAFSGELSEDDVDMIRRAAPFHDIGKIGVSDLLLLKRGVLTNAEYKEVQKHTTIGSRMMEQIYQRTPNQRYLKMATIIAGGHHERWDGKGYPQGLKGENIPLCCRILSVANVFDACVTDKIYRRALTHEQACEVISGGKGTEFDPRIVEVFEKMPDKFALLHAHSHFQPNAVDWRIYHEANPGS